MLTFYHTDRIYSNIFAVSDAHFRNPAIPHPHMLMEILWDDLGRCELYMHSLHAALFST